MSTQNENGVTLLPLKIRFVVFVAPRDYGGTCAVETLQADLVQARLMGLTPEAMISSLRPKPCGLSLETIVHTFSEGGCIPARTPLLAWQVL